MPYKIDRIQKKFKLKNLCGTPRSLRLCVEILYIYKIIFNRIWHN